MGFFISTYIVKYTDNQGNSFIFLIEINRVYLFEITGINYSEDFFTALLFSLVSQSKTKNSGVNKPLEAIHFELV